MFITSLIKVGLLILILAFALWKLIPSPKRINRHDVVLIAGACGGLGTELCREFACKQCVLILIDKNESELKSLARELDAQGVTLFSLASDLTKYEEIETFLTNLIKNKFIPTHFIFNAAIAGPKPILHLKLSDFDHIMDVNVKSFLNIVQILLPKMILQNKGHIIAVSSVLASTGAFHYGPYCASKACLARLMEALHDETVISSHHNIHFTTVYPAKINTPLFENINYCYYIRFVLPVLSPKYVASRIVLAIELRQHYVYIPFYFGICLNILNSRILMWFARNMSWRRSPVELFTNSSSHRQSCSQP